MGGSPLLPIGSTDPSPGDVQALTDALGGWSSLLAGAGVALGIGSIPPAGEPAATDPMALLDKLATDLRRQVYAHLIANGTPQWWALILAYLADGIVFALGIVPSFVLWVAEIFGPPLTNIALQLIDAFRKGIDTQVAQTSVLVLNELLGTDYGAESFPTGPDVASHRARAQQVGSLYVNSITDFVGGTTDLETVDGFAGVEKFTGLIVNFGISTALLGLAGELGTLGLIKDFRLIGEQVSSGLGLSKQMRIAIKPLLKTLVATPFQWKLNQTYFPSRFNVGEVVNPFAQTLMDHDTIVKDLELNGWSPDRAESLIKLHQKRLTPDEVELLVRWSNWTHDQAIQYIKDLGWPDELAETVLNLPNVKRFDSRANKLLDELEANVKNGDMSFDDFQTVVQASNYPTQEQSIILATVQTKVKAPHKSLTIAELQQALDKGLITVDDVDAALASRGYTSSDLQTLEALILLNLAKQAEAIKLAQFTYDAKVAKAQKAGAPVPPPPAILAGT